MLLDKIRKCLYYTCLNQSSDNDRSIFELQLGGIPRYFITLNPESFNALWQVSDPDGGGIGSIPSRHVGQSHQTKVQKW